MIIEKNILKSCWKVLKYKVLYFFDEKIKNLKTQYDICIVVTDGLSAVAIDKNFIAFWNIFGGRSHCWVWNASCANVQFDFYHADQYSCFV